MTALRLRCRRAELTIAFPDAATQTIAEAMRPSPPVSPAERGHRRPGVTITGVTMAVNPNVPTKWMMTAFGAFTGASRSRVATLFYRYSAEFASLPRRTLRYLDDRGREPRRAGSGLLRCARRGAIATLADSFVTTSSTDVAIMADTMRETVAAAIGAPSPPTSGGGLTALGIAANADGSPGPLPPSITSPFSR